MLSSVISMTILILTGCQYTGTGFENVYRTGRGYSLYCMPSCDCQLLTLCCLQPLTGKMTDTPGRRLWSLTQGPLPIFFVRRWISWSLDMPLWNHPNAATNVNKVPNTCRGTHQTKHSKYSDLLSKPRENLQHKYWEEQSMACGLSLRPSRCLLMTLHRNPSSKPSRSCICACKYPSRLKTGNR